MIIFLKVKGASAHGMEPKNGKNAGLFLAEFLSKLNLDEKTAHYFQLSCNEQYENTMGKLDSLLKTDGFTI